MSKKFITFILSLIVIINFSFSQSGWISKFFNNTGTISKIIQRDNNNYIGLCYSSKYFFKSSDSGNNWICQQNYSFDSAYSLYDGQFITSQTGWVVGSNIQFGTGEIFKTTNGGENWIKQITGFNNYQCYCLFFLDENTGWIGSSGGTIGWLLKTTNGGINWTKQDFVGAYQIRSVKFLDVNNGWILGLYGLIARTTNGGQNWIQKNVTNIPCSNSNFTKLYALSTQECWLLVRCVSGGLLYSHLLKTNNAGDNWNLMFSYTDSLTTDGKGFSDVKFINNSTGFINGEFNFVMKTTNLGNNWDRIPVASVSGIYPVISSLLPINDYEIFAAGGYSGLGSYRPYNYVLKSTNTGFNWSFKAYNWEYNFQQAFFLDNNLGFVIGDSGKVFKTSNGGNNWEVIFNDRTCWIKNVTFANVTTGCMLGGINYYDFNKKILRTTNGGSNWSEVFFSSSLKVFFIKLIDQQVGFAGCDSNKFLKTSNAGLNWNIVNLSISFPCNIVNVSFINSSTGWLLGNYCNGFSCEKNIIWKSTNGGNNWDLIYDSTGIRGDFFFQFTDNNIGYKLSWNPAKVQKTSNGGINWFNFVIPNLIYPNCLNFINGNTGWIGGMGGSWGRVVKTTDAGFSWVLQLNENNKIVRFVQAFDNNNAWICGDYSSVFNTTNGGGMITIGISPINNKTPRNFSLSQNYPNPFNPQTKIKFDIPNQSFAKLIIYDILGREIATLVNEQLTPGTYEIGWDGSNYSSGLYFYKLVVRQAGSSTGDFIETKKMILMK